MTREVQQLREDKQQLNAALRSQDEQVVCVAATLRTLLLLSALLLYY
jgi:hypothetical protein